MKAIVVQQAGNADQLHYQEWPQPTFKPCEVLIKHQAIGVNFIDIYVRTGLYPPAAYPYIPGKEGSGVVAAVGSDVREFKVGDRVVYTSGSSGSYAEYTVVAENQLIPLPEAIDFCNGAACLLQGLTAHYLIHDTFAVQPGHTVLIHAAAGGVGLLLIQLIKQLGARVIGLVSAENKKQLAEEFGADHILLYDHPWHESVRQLTGGHGVEVVYDSVGKTTFDQSLLCLKRRGMLVSFGQSSGKIPPFEMSRLAAGSLSLCRPSLGDYTATREALLQRAAQLFQCITTDNLRIHIGQQWKLAEARLAHQALEDRKTNGKVLLIP